MVNRYKDLISEKENRSISEIRQRVSPYNNDFLKSLRDRLLNDMKYYEFNKDFFTALQRTLTYIREITNVETLIPFWMSFEEIDQLKAADIMDKAILFAALLRSFESNDARVYVTKSKRIYVGFSFNKMPYLVDIRNGSLIGGPDADNAFLKDSLSYVFSDLHFESFEDE
jgi:hypothetical protein